MRQIDDSQDSRACEIATISEVRGGHHVLWVEHLLCQLRNADSTEVMSATTCKRSKPDHEEVQTREWNHVDGQFAEIRVQLTGKSEARRYTRHDS